MGKVYLFCLILLAIGFSCAQIQKGDTMEDHLATLPPSNINENICVGEVQAAYKTFEGSWRDSLNVRYYIDYPPATRSGKVVVDYFNNSDKQYVKDKTKLAMDQWSFAVNKPIIEVNSKDKANLIITFKFLEDESLGKALSSFPPLKGQSNKTMIRMDLADMWQAVKDRDKAKDTYYTVILHEACHSVAGLFHDNELSVSNPKRKYSTLQIDDIVGARANIGNFSDFTFQGKHYTYIDFKKGNVNKTINFKTREFFTRCSYPKYSDGHFLSLNAINGIQYIRAHYGCAIKINSTHRDINCNKLAHGASLSQHQFYNAIDWRFVGKGAYAAQAKYESDIVNRKVPLQVLLKLGIRGFGSYPNNANHIDARNVIVGSDKAFNTQFITWAEFRKRGSFYNPELEYNLYD